MTEEQRQNVSRSVKARWARVREEKARVVQSDSGNAVGFIERAERELTTRAHKAVDDRNQKALSMAMAKLATLADYRAQVEKVMSEQIEPSRNGENRVSEYANV